MEVRFSEDAFADLERIEDYLLYKWNQKIWEDFNQKLDTLIDLIIEGSVIIEKFEYTDFKKVSITKHNTLIYKTDKKILNVFRILQDFQDPEKNYKILQHDL